MDKKQGAPAILHALRRRWLLLLLVAVPVAAAVGAYAQLAPARYDAQTTVAFSPRPSVPIGADVLRVVLPRYVSLLKAQATVDSVARETSVPTTVVEGADVTIATDSANVLIVVGDTDPEQAATAANALAATALHASLSDDLLDAQQVARALPPDSPSAPARSLLTAAGVLAGLLLGMTAAVLAERRDTRVRDDDDVVSTAAVDVLGHLPSARRSRTRRKSRPIWTDLRLISAARGILLRAQHALRPSGSAVLGITSPSGTHGRTTLVLAYAAAAARQNRTVILVDADPAGRGLTAALADPAADLPDVTALLRGKGAVDKCLIPGPIEGVRLVPAPTGPEAVDALASGLPDLLAKLSNRSDLVVVDCPSLDDPDAAVSLVHLPAVLLVVRSGSRGTALAESRALLQNLGPQPLGVVLNHGVSRRRSSRTDLVKEPA